MEAFPVQTCGVCNTQSPDEVTQCARCGSDLREKSETALARAHMQANERASLIRVSVMHDACPACDALQGAYPKDQVPVLPVEGCSHPLGCRCFYEPVLTEVYP
jgi:ribosomal protein L40E